MSFSIKSIIMNNKEILFNLAVLLSSFGFVCYYYVHMKHLKIIENNPYY